MSKRYFRNSAFAFFALFLMAASREGAAPKEGPREPIVITSDSMKATELLDVVEFSGNVILKKEGMTLYSDAATVFYDAGTKSIRVIDAEGNVVVRKEGRVAYSQHAQYYSSEDKIVLTGEARIIENENELKGDRITLFMQDDRSIVEGGKVLFYKESSGPGKPTPAENDRKSETGGGKHNKAD